jgi:hypothetical protein
MIGKYLHIGIKLLQVPGQWFSTGLDTMGTPEQQKLIISIFGPQIGIIVMFSHD